MQKRPLSPHLQIYKPQISSVLSIMHRFSGVGLFLGLLILVIGLACLATSELAFVIFQDFLSGIIGKSILFLCLLGFFYHFANGIRHLGWDIGFGYDIGTMEKTGIFVLIFTLASTISVWFYF